MQIRRCWIVCGFSINPGRWLATTHRKSAVIWSETKARAGNPVRCRRRHVFPFLKLWQTVSNWRITDTSTSELEAIGTSDPGKLINLGKKFLDAGVERLMIESEGITENVTNWRTDVVSQIMKQLPQEKVMFEGKTSSIFCHSKLNWFIAGSRRPESV